MGGQDGMEPLHCSALTPLLPCAAVGLAVHIPSSHRNCRSFSRRSLPLLDMMSSGTLGAARDTLVRGVGQGESPDLGTW